jgi:hypothetical protein
MTEDLNVKQADIATFYNAYKNRRYLQKILKMTSWMAWMQRPSGLIQRGRKHKRLKLRLI